MGLERSIFCITDNLSEGGAQRVALAVARQIHRQSRLGGFYLLNPFNAVYKEEAQGLPIISLLGNHWNKLLYPVCFLSFWMRLLKRRPTVVFSTLLPSNLVAVVAGRLLFGYRPRIVIREANTLYSRAKSLGGLAMSLYRLARMIYPLADVVVAPSQGVADDLIRHLKISADKVRVIHNPTLTVNLLALAETGISHPYLKSRSSMLYVAAGRLAAAKGFDTLLTAFSSVYKAQPDARLIILGEGPDRPMLEKQRHRLGLDQVVDLPGFVENPFAYMKAADVFVLASRWEGLPNVLIQAIACGTTPVSTDCPSGPAEILADGQYGYLVPVDDSEALAEKMLYAGENPLPESRLLERAQTFHEDKICAEYMELFLHV